MKVIEDYLTVNPYSRVGRKRDKTLGIVIHWVGNPGTSPQANRDFWEARKDGSNGYGSAHSIVGINGSLLLSIPYDEVAWHCGATKPTVEGGNVYYTDEARKAFPKYTKDYQHQSPNSCLVGIEFCHKDWDGAPSPECYETLVEEVARLCKYYRLDETDLWTHKGIVGYKDCPHYYNVNGEAWEKFKADVKGRLK